MNGIPTCKVVQKTWVDLLGMDTSNCQVDGNRIIRRLNGDECRILWVFDNYTQAQAAFNAWMENCST